MSNPEIIPSGNERGHEAHEAAAERSKELLESIEQGAESSPETNAERAVDARRTAHAEALLSKESGGAEMKRGQSDGEPSLTHATKQQRTESYDATMRTIQRDMTPASRRFSKVIHNRTVERASDSIGSTLARPNAVLAGSVCATALTLFVYLVAKQYGYRLSGFESIGAFAVGWAAGLLYDYTKMMLSRQRK